MSGYWEAFFSGILQAPLLYAQGFLVFFLLECKEGNFQPTLTKRNFYECLSLISLLLYFLIGTFVRKVEESPFFVSHLFFLYLVLFCVLYEGLLVLFRRRASHLSWNPVHFTVLFMVVSGIFYTTEKFGASLQLSLIFIVGQCLGIFLFVQIILTLYKHIFERYHGPKVLKNPIGVVFLSFFLSGFIAILQQFLDQN